MFWFFFLVIIFLCWKKIDTILKDVRSNKESNCFACDVIISFSLFWLLVNAHTIINIFDNSDGCFMVYIECIEIVNSTDILVFYDSDCKEVKTIEMNKRGRLNVNSDEKQIIVSYNNYEAHFDYNGNEIDNNTSLDSSVTRIYTPYSNYTEIRSEINFWGYEYLLVKKNNIEQNIYLDITIYLKKLFMALSISSVIYALLRKIPYVVRRSVTNPK